MNRPFRMGQGRLWLTALLLIGPAAGLLGAAEAKPLRILAGHREVAAIYRDLAERYPYYYKACYGKLDAAALGECSSVIAASGAQFDVKNAALRGFLEAGGNLVLVGQSATALLPELKDLVGAKARIAAAPKLGHTIQSNHPLFAGTSAEFWANLNISNVLADAEGGEILMGRTGGAAVWLRTVGKGKLLFIAGELFPPYPAQGPKPAEFGPFKANLLKFLAVPPLTEAVAEKQPVVWYREPSFQPFEGARSFYPLSPAEGEKLSALEFTAGRGERGRILFYVTVSGAPGAVKAQIGPLKGKTGEIPAENIRLGIQDRLGADFAGPLIFVRWLEKDETLPVVSPVLTCWLEVATGDAPPGEYAGAIRLAAGEQTVEAPVRIQVASARLPAQRPFHFDVEFYNVAPHKLQPDYLRHWREFGVDMLMGGPISYDVIDPPVRSDGRPGSAAPLSLTQFAKAAAAPLRDNVPPLDFSALDAYFQEGLRNGFTLFRTYEWFMGRQNYLNYAKALYRNDALTADSPEVSQTATAVLRELRRYLLEKGYRDIYSKTGDEWGPADLDFFLQRAIPLYEAGWGNVANPGLSVLSTPDMRQKLWPRVALWWMEGDPSLWRRLQRKEPVLGGPADVEHGYWMVLTSSFWWNHSYLQGLKYGWAGAWRDYNGLHFHGWNRGFYESQGAWLLKEGAREFVCPSVGYLMLAEGLQEAQYPVMLKDMIAVLERSGKGPVAADLKAGLQKIVDESPGAMLPVQADSIEKKDLSRADFTKAKLAVFALMEKAAPHLRGVAPTLAWGPVVLVDQGKPKLSICCDAKSTPAAEALRSAVREKAGATLDLRTVNPVEQDWSALKNAVILVDISDAAVCGRVSAHLRGAVHARYPAAGGYSLVEDGRGNLWIVARDAETLTLGAQNLVRAAKLQPVWWPAR